MTPASLVASHHLTTQHGPVPAWGGMFLVLMAVIVAFAILWRIIPDGRRIGRRKERERRRPSPYSY